MSLVKKNIKRKHEKDRILKNVLAYKNLHEMKMTLKINDNQVKKIMKSIEKSFKKHSNNIIEKLKIIKNNNKIISLLQHLIENMITCLIIKINRRISLNKRLNFSFVNIFSINDEIATREIKIIR